MSAKSIVPILSGGGTRLPAYIGVLQALNDLDLTFNTLVGVSGGSIIASLYSSGHSLEQIKSLAWHTDFRQFRDFSLYRLLKDGGLSSGDRFEKWMDKQLGGACFKDLSKDLHVMATDVNGGGPVIFNAEQTPDLKVAKAVRFSMSIPLIFSFKRFEQHLLVDGAILSEDALFRHWSEKAPSICFRLKSEPQKRALTKRRLFLPDYVMMLIRTFMTTLSREYVPEGYWHNTLVINTGKTSAVDFTMTLEQKQWLYQQGLDSVLQYLPNKLTQLTHKSHI